jgi:hypothetical protein
MGPPITGTSFGLHVSYGQRDGTGDEYLFC